ncbi:hypothetical protein KK092_09670 [Curtobacterium flaccumfaciens pv. flaccumfaciens]|uniref:hypothetical protein n=1 Tax=Curtobacterium flaccumfaciens TaxID=2035 RepID=UPI001BDE84CF|nr:hypothetical protein [Curtobacterium flaccumfaciens]MBT1669649.1 hypothetical protein [Curtobacterium flaccumfaciens pv. flaccumfaciens]
MSELVTWEHPEIVERGDRQRPDFAEDPRFTFPWRWWTDDLTSSENEWRSYSRDDEEIARLLLVRNFRSHTTGRSAPAVLISNLEVPQGLRETGRYIGTSLVNELVEEFRGWEIYIGPTSSSTWFWKRFRWPMCDCEACDGQDLIVRRPA